MKTENLCLLFLAFFFFSCGRVSLQEPPTAPVAPIEPATDSCPYPEYDPPAMVPGTNCNDPCQYVYEGWVDFEAGVLEINCQSLPLSSPALMVSIDSVTIRHVDYGYLKVLRIQAPGIGAWCRDKVFFMSEGCPGPEHHSLYLAHDGMSEYRVIWPEGFWDCAAGKLIRFRMIARNPLPLEGIKEP